MLRIYRIDHIAVVTADLEEQAALLEGLFGFEPTHTWDNPAARVRGMRLRVPGASGQYWVLLSPADSGTVLGRWLEDRDGRPGLHHVGAEVPDLDAALAEIRRRGLEITDSVPGRWAETSLSPPEHGPGVLWRLQGPGSTSMLGDEAARPAPRRAAADAPTLGIRGIDHLCQAFPDRDELAAWYAELAGFVEVWRTPEGAAPDMADLVLNIPGSSTCWEVITGRGEASFVDRFLRRSGPAAHHVTFEVADWDNALAACVAHGVPTFGEEEGVTDGAAWKHTFIHPKHTGGVLVQLFWEQRPGVWVRSDKIASFRSV
ncbi:VOC family protein [Streptomyces sp. NRRL F-5755]|uniref:VOC family protein n=1 Tax=Streptomyces sp. NRRL F-5755 TaxID=1519475 RepID=UPI000B1BC1C9|nr:VOC family protein [Streptomyces sp. NRRL F-5755]